MFRLGLRRWLSVVCVGASVLCAHAQQAAHTDPLNLDPQVRQAYEKFYNLDYDGALAIWNGVAAKHANDPMAWDYVLVGTIMRELYRQDLLDTTYYARDNFLTNKRTTTIEPAVRRQIDDLAERVNGLADAALKANPNDKNALFARSYAKGFHGSFALLVDHAYLSAARQGLAARNDAEAVLKLDPQYADADMPIGIQQFAVASLPRMLRLMVGIAGVGGNKEKGLAMLRESATHGTITSVESKTVMSLFLRHDGRYTEALTVQRALAAQYPHNFLFRLEVANILKDAGQGYNAIGEYRMVLSDAAKPGYFAEPRLQLAYFGLADTERGYNLLREAAADYTHAAEQHGASDWLRKRAALGAGQTYDLLHDRAEAVKMYQIAAAPGGDQTQADTARKYLSTPYTGK